MARLIIGSEDFEVKLLDYSKNHNQDYFDQYWDQDYLSLILVGLANIMDLMNLSFCV